MTVNDLQALPANLSFTGADGARVSLQQLRGDSPAIVYFMRASSCPVCLRTVRVLSRIAADPRHRAVRVVVVVPGDADDAASVRAKAGSPVAVVSSSGVDAHEAAGLGRTMLLQHSGTFLIDAAGRARYAKTAAMPTGSFDERELLAAVAGL